jgi:tRNA G18 (ribose-2'-O)-methylase SpoU
MAGSTAVKVENIVVANYPTSHSSLRVTMPTVLIDCLDDDRLEPYRRLKDTNQTRWSGQFICEGQILVERLLASDFEVASVLVDQPHYEQMQTLISPKVETFVVPPKMVPQIVGFNFHRGVLACGRRKPSPPLEDLVMPADKGLTLAVCPDVQDPVNLGSIARIAQALGIDALVLGPQCADPFSRRVLRVSMGAVLRLPVVQVSDLEGTLRDLRSRYGVELAATVLSETAELLDRAHRSRRFALLLGNEGQGLPENLVAICQRRLTIPMSQGADSLNVSVAAGIFFYHFTRHASFLETCERHDHQAPNMLE